ncbi:hypothetical protein [Streptomyces sp. NPDC086787]|uniref:hypothetical protein n=1 Tax=Streptomyces sp. NPDC086787 TaxID=3365759 RepID=UPI0038102A8C
MRSRGRTLKFTAVSALVVLSLTGFTSGRGHGHGHSGGGGGGCSSSGQDHDASSSGGGAYKDDDHGGSGGGSGSYRDPYDDTDDYGSGSSGGGTSAPAFADGTAKLLSCATPKKPYATVEVTNPNGTATRFDVTITFDDARGAEVASASEEAVVPANGRATVQLEVQGADRAARVARCDLEPVAVASG